MTATTLRGRCARLVVPGLQYHLLALAFFVVVFALIPFSIYAHSGEEWPFPFRQLLAISTLGIVLFAGCALSLRLIAGRSVRAATTFAHALFCIGAFLLLAYVYAPAQIGPLDGSEHRVDEPMLHSVIEFGLFAAALFAFVQLRRGRGLGIAALFSVALLVLGLGYVAAFAFAETRVQQVQAPTAAAPDIEGNVYHIVLDSMRTPMFLSALEQSSTTDHFGGFELFQYNVSNYITTIPSSASYFTGTRYNSGEFKQWVQQWRRDKGIFPAVSDRGYRVWMYAPFPHWKTRHVDRFWYNMDIHAQDTEFSADTGFYDLIHIWLVNLAPTALTHEALPVAAASRDRIFSLLTGEPKPFSLNDLHPHAGVAMLRRLLREEALRAPNGQYVYAHAALPHAPFVFDPECRYVGQGERGRPGYLEQAQCAVSLVVAFFEELKRRGRFDAATIILHSDTGHGVARVGAGSRDGGATTLGTANEALLRAVDALLMIKRPYASGPLELVPTPTQLVDVFPSIVDILGLERAHELDGRSVYAVAPGEKREARFAFDPNRKYGHDFVEVRIEDQTDLHNSKLSVIGPATDPASRYAQDKR